MDSGWKPRLRNDPENSFPPKKKPKTIPLLMNAPVKSEEKLQKTFVTCNFH